MCTYKRFSYAEKFFFSHSSQFWHSGFLKGCEAIEPLSHIARRTKARTIWCGPGIPAREPAVAEPSDLAETR